MLASAVLALTACGGDETPGAATAIEPTSTTTAAASTTAAPTSDAPAADRPVDLPLDGVGPCDLVSAPARSAFGIDGEVTASSAGEGAGATLCVARATATGRFVVVTVIGQGMDELEPGDDVAIGGFPASELRGGVFPNMCHVSIDVADAQRLDVEIQPTDTALTQDKVCQDTTAFAESVLAELRQRLGR